MVLVVAGTLDLRWFPIQEQTPVRVKRHGAYTEGDALAVEDLAFRFDRDNSRGEIWGLHGPQRGTQESRAGVEFRRVMRFDPLLGRSCGGDCRAGGIEHAPLHCRSRGVVILVRDDRGKLEGGVIALYGGAY